MADANHQALECEVRRCLERSDHAEAATLAIRGLGAEVFGFLVSIHRDEAEAAEVFSLFTERLWRSLAAYEGDCSIRTWAYVLARHASLNHRRGEQRRNKRLRPLIETSEGTQLVAEARSETASYLRSDRQARFAALRQELSLEDQTLLILHVNRGLSWLDLARVLHAGGAAAGDAEPEALPAPLSGQALVREAARLRKRFQLIKKRLLVRGRQAGVVTVKEED